MHCFSLYSKALSQTEVGSLAK